MKIEYQSHSTGEKTIEIVYEVEIDNYWITESHTFDLSECYDQSYQLATPDYDKSGEFIQNGILELKGYIQELEKEEEIGIDKYMTMEILRNHLKKTYPNEEIEII